MNFSRTFLMQAFFTALGLCSLWAGEAAGQGVAFQRTEYRVYGVPAGIVVGDFDGDGKLDLAVANANFDGVSILLGNGDGTFGAQTDFATGRGPVGIVAGDFNGDGKLDLATANITDGTVSILLGNGDGTFGTNTDFATGTDPTGIAVGDFNGDGKPDLVTANVGGDDVSILLGQGGGVFGANVNFATSGWPRSVVVEDFNGDGKLDVAVVASLSGAVSLLLGNGDGTFGAKTDFPAGSLALSLAKSDFNGDVKLDLVAANFFDATASILMGKGDGTFDPKTDLGTDTEPIAVTASDFNADGKADFLTANTGYFAYTGYYGYLYTGYAPTVTLWRGNGDGTFGNRMDFPLLSNIRPGAVATGDFNADGRIDVVVTNPLDATVSVLLQSAAVTISLGGHNFGPLAVGSTSSPQTFTLDSTGSFPVTVSSVTLSGMNPGEFIMQSDSCSGNSIASGSSCSMGVVFSPTTAGYKRASLVLTHDAPGSPITINLFGTGVAPVPTPIFSPSSLDFGSQTVGSSSVVQGVGLTNSGTGNLTITSISVTGTNAAEFLMTNNCPASLSTNTSCAIDVTFRPTSTGTKLAAVSVVTNAAGSPHTVPLTGIGVNPAVSLSPTSLTFNPQAIGTSSAAQNVTLMNAGGATLTITSLMITNSPDFLLTSNCGTSLAAGANCTISVVSAPTRAGATTGTVNIVSNAPSSPDSVALSGSGVGPGALFSATSLDFPNQPINVTSAPKSVTLSNGGNADLIISAIGVNNGFVFTQTNNCPGTLAPAASCTFNVTFTPLGALNYVGSLSITDNAGGSPHLVDLSGSGVAAPVVSLSPTSLGFNPQVIGTPSGALSVTLTNSGGATLTIASIAQVGVNAAEFSLTNNCGASLAAGANCTLSIVFSPTSAGAKAASVSLVTNAVSSPDLVALSGTGNTPATVGPLPAAVTFGAQLVNTTSAAQTVTLTNVGGATLTIASIALVGVNAAEFSLTNNCGASLSTGANCTFSVVFTPTSAGAKAASVSLVTNAVSSPDTVALSGTGITPAAVSLSPASLTFYPQLVSTTSAAQTVTLTNSGGATLTITSLTLGGANAGDFARSDNCGSSVDSGASCVITLTFRPTATGGRTASVSISSNANGSPHSVALNGTGADFSVNPPTGNPSVTVNPGGSASFTLSLAPTNGYTGNVALSCSTSSPEVSCAVPASVAVNGPTNVTVNVTTTSQAWMPFRSLPPKSAPSEDLNAAVAWLAALLLLGAALRGAMARRGRMRLRLRPAMVLAAIVLCARLWIGCGGESIPRPSRTYTITVSASTAGVVRMISLTVIVP